MTNDISMLHQVVVSPFRESSSVNRKDNGGHETTGQEAAKTQDQEVRTKEQAQDKLEEMVSGLNELVHELHRELRFSLDKESGEVVIKVIDRETDTVVRQLPPEEVLRLRKRLQEAAGVIFQDQA